MSEQQRAVNQELHERVRELERHVANLPVRWARQGRPVESTGQYQYMGIYMVAQHVRGWDFLRAHSALPEEIVEP